MMPPRTDPAEKKVGVLMSLEFSPAQLNSWSQRWSLESSVAPNPPQVASQTSIPFEQKCTFAVPQHFGQVVCLFVHVEKESAAAVAAAAKWS